MLRAIRHFTKFALGARLIDADPAVAVTRAKMTKTDGLYTWTEEDVLKFEAAPEGLQGAAGAGALPQFGNPQK
jgi:hypothetical protein